MSQGLGVACMEIDPLLGGLDSAKRDGRRLRRDRNRQAVLNQVIELFARGNYQPSLVDVAEAAGISLRSLYRYFEEPNQLIVEAIKSYLDGYCKIDRFRSIGIGQTSFKIDTYLEFCFATHTVDIGVSRAARFAGVSNFLITKLIEIRSIAAKEVLTEHFAAELEVLDDRAREVALESLLFVCQCEGIDFLLGRHVNNKEMVVAVGRLLCLAALRGELLGEAFDYAASDRSA